MGAILDCERLRVFRLKTLLVATDLTKRSRAVLPRAAQLARLHGARIILAHATRKAKVRARPLVLARRAFAADPEARLAELAATYPDLQILCHTEAAAPEEMMARLAAQHDVDLVVLGLHLSRRVLETLRLTTLEKITLAVPCPVLIAHDTDIRPYASILGAVTFSPVSAYALGVAAKLAPGAEIDAIHALKVPLAAKLPTTDVMTSDNMAEADMLRRGFMSLETVPPECNQPEIVPGGVHEVLQFRIEELRPDLVVIASGSGRAQNTLGNYARDLMRAPPTDMLVVKPA